MASPQTPLAARCGRLRERRDTSTSPESAGFPCQSQGQGRALLDPLDPLDPLVLKVLLVPKVLLAPRVRLALLALTPQFPDPKAQQVQQGQQGLLALTPQFQALLVPKALLAPKGRQDLLALTPQFPDPKAQQVQQGQQGLLALTPQFQALLVPKVLLALKALPVPLALLVQTARTVLESWCAARSPMPRSLRLRIRRLVICTCRRIAQQRGTLATGGRGMVRSGRTWGRFVGRRVSRVM
jgi:hypothetical protein